MKSLFFTFITLFSFITYGASVEEAQELFSHRADGLEYAQGAADMYKELAAAGEIITEEKARRINGQLDALFFVGTHTDGKENKMRIHENAYKIAEKNIKLLDSVGDKSKLLGYALYWYGAHLGKWGEAKGVLASLGKWPKLKKAMNRVIKLGPTIAAGVEFSGAHRILGRGFYKLPAIYGGKKKSEKFLKIAFDKSLGENDVAKMGLTNIYYAETLIARKKKAKARDILNKFIASTDDLNPARIPENVEAREEAEKILNSLED